MDGTICDEPNIAPPEKYKHSKVYPEAITFLRALKERGHEVIIYSSRHSEDRELTEKFLEENNVPFDELVLGKPRAELYIDDRAMKFKGWNYFDEYIVEVRNAERF